DDAAQDIADRTVRAPPHLLEAELLDPRLVWGNGGALHADADFLDLLGRVDGDLVVGRVPAFHAEVVVEQVDVQVGQDQLVLDELPDDAGHLVAVEFDDRIGYLDPG